MKKEFVFHRIEDPMKRPSMAKAGARPAGVPSLERLVGCDVIDSEGTIVGTVSCIWEDASRQAAFLGVRTGWLGMGKIHVVPAYAAQFSTQSETIRLPFTSEIVKNAPSFDADARMSK